MLRDIRATARQTSSIGRDSAPPLARLTAGSPHGGIVPPLWHAGPCRRRIDEPTLREPGGRPMWPGSHSVEGSSSSTDSDQHILYTYIHAERCDSEPEEIHSDTDSRAPVGVRPRRRLGYRGREDVVRVAAAGARWSRGNGPGRAGTSAQAGPVTRPGRPSGLPCRQSRRCGPRTPVRSGPARRRRAPGTRAAAVERHRRNYIYTYIYIYIYIYIIVG